jgi:CBS domain-containing protein
MMGGALGGIEAAFFPAAGAGFWPLVSMGAILGGTMRSPLTGVVFALELTHDVNVLLPLLVASVVAHAFTVLTLRRSILTEKVARRGFHVSREYAVDPLEVLFVRDVMSLEPASPRTEAAGATAHPDEPLRVVVYRMAETGLTDLPVVDGSDGRAVVGRVTLRDLLQARVRHLEEERRRERVFFPNLRFPLRRAG